jgi:hypothetical protein
VYQLSAAQYLWRNINMFIRIYPLLSSLHYLNSNQLICATVNGEHRIYQGPGFHCVVGVTDRIWKPQEIGVDINFGPIKIIFVKPGRLKFVMYRNTGK